MTAVMGADAEVCDVLAPRKGGSSFVENHVF